MTGYKLYLKKRFRKTSKEDIKDDKNDDTLLDPDSELSAGKVVGSTTVGTMVGHCCVVAETVPVGLEKVGF
jgi:hypothetical protein